MRKIFSSSILVLLLLGTAPISFSATLEDVANDFRPAAGFVIKVIDEEYLVDLDAGKGARVGDLLAVIVPGEQVVHPVTMAVLGNLDAVKGFLQVTRVKSGYSYARQVDKGGVVDSGDAVRRFENVPATFIDEDGNSENVYQKLILLLPQLEWQGYAREKAVNKEIPLLFILRAGNLTVQGPDRAVLASYSLTEPGTPAASSTPAAIIAAPPETAIVHQESATKGVWLSSDLPGEAVGIEIGDFDGDGSQEVATAFPYRLDIGRVSGGKYVPLASLDLGLGLKVLGLDASDLDGDGRMELYLTAANDGELQSQAVAWTGGGYQIVRKQIPWFLRSVQLPGEGRVLLAQRMGGLEQDFSGEIFRVELRDGKLVEGKAVSAPMGANLYGFTIFESTDRQPVFALLTPRDQLKVLSLAAVNLWSGDENFGGSESFIERIDPTRAPVSGPATRSAFMQQRIETGPNGELLIPANEGNRLTARYRKFTKSSIRAMSWNGFALQELWRTQPQNGYLADFRLADIDNDGQAEIVQALVFSRDGMMSKGRSAIAAFEIDD